MTAFILILGSVLPVWTVEAAPKPELSIADKTITEGGNFTLEVENEIDGSTCQWTSSNEKVAAVSNEGVVKGIKEGTATITCTLTVESTKKTYSLKCRVRVLGIPEKMTGIQGKNEKDAEALTKIIKEQLAGGAVVPTDLNDERYTWNESGRLVGIDLRKAGLTGKLDVSRCTALESLDCRENELTGLDASGCTALTHLDLGANQISDLSGLKKVENLTWLALDSNEISDISELRELTSLTELFLQDNLINDIAELRGLINLTRLSLGNNEISDISVLGNLKNLTSLYVNNNRIRDITVFRKMENLQELDLSGNEISDIMVLKETINLKKLNLSDTMISDITVLRRLTKLTELELITSQVSDVTALQELTDLKILFLDKNQISDGQVAELQRKLPDCSIW